MSRSPVNYRIIEQEAQLAKDPPTDIMYEYLMTGSGVFVQGKRPGLTVTLPVADACIRGLLPIKPEVKLEYPPVDEELLTRMLDISRHSFGADGSCLEALFYLSWTGTSWHLEMPAQKQGHVSVRPLDTGMASAYARALIEVHSHHRMSAFFSATDDADEVGFRIYVVLGDIYNKPAIRVRVGLYGYRMEIPAGSIFELPVGIYDALNEKDR